MGNKNNTTEGVVRKKKVILSITKDKLNIKCFTWNRLISLGFPAFFRQFWLHLRKNFKKNLQNIRKVFDTDQYLFSSYNIMKPSNKQMRRIKKMINNYYRQNIVEKKYVTHLINSFRTKTLVGYKQFGWTWLDLCKVCTRNARYCNKKEMYGCLC